MANWDQTASLSAVVANTVRDPAKHKKPYSATDFHPMRANVVEDGRGDLGALKEAMESWQAKAAR